MCECGLDPWPWSGTCKWWGTGSTCSIACKFGTQHKGAASIRGAPKGCFQVRKYNSSWSQSLCQKRSSLFKFWEDCRGGVLGFYCCSYGQKLCCSKDHLSVLMRSTPLTVLNYKRNPVTFFVVLFYWIIWCLHPGSHATVKSSRWSLFLRAVQQESFLCQKVSFQWVLCLLPAPELQAIYREKKKSMFLYIYVFSCFAAARLHNSNEKLTNLFIARGHR